MIISVLCILLVGTSVIVYFVAQSNSSPYGDRLEGLDEHKLGNTLSDLETFYKEQTGVNSATVRLQGKIHFFIPFVLYNRMSHCPEVNPRSV